MAGRRRSTVRRLVVVWAVSLLAVGAAARVVALPESCGPVTSAQRRSAATETVDWFARNQSGDGTFLYRVDAATGESLGGYSWVRHAGVLLSLEQARAAGIEDAAVAADRGWAALDDRIVEWGDRAGLLDGDRVTGGGTALAVAALAERREATDATDRDALMRSLGRQLLAMVRSDGTVAEVASAVDGTPDPSSIGRFTTGEVAFALARLERILPGEGWGAPVHTILGYLALDKAEAEGFVPDMADHWGAYTLAEVVRWETGGVLTEVERAWARKQMGMLSVMIRFESQRTNDGIDRWLRGRTSIGSAVGTHGESMQGWVQVADADPALRDQAVGARERLACNSAVLVDRQVTAEDAAAMPEASMVRGTWLWFGVTQMDDQQHALSALLGAESVLPDDSAAGGGVLPRRAPTPESTWLALLAVVLAVDPVRFARRTRGVRLPAVGVGSLGSVAGVVLLAAAGSSVLRALDVSVPTAVVAAGLVLAVAAVVSALGTWRQAADVPVARGWWAAVVPVAVPSLLRPELLVLALALGAGGRVEIVAAGSAVAVLCGLGVRTLVTRHPGAEPLARWAEQVTSLLTVAVALALLVDGIYAV